MSRKQRFRKQFSEILFIRNSKFEKFIRKIFLDTYKILIFPLNRVYIPKYIFMAKLVTHRF